MGEYFVHIPPTKWGNIFFPTSQLLVSFIERSFGDNWSVNCKWEHDWETSALPEVVTPSFAARMILNIRYCQRIYSTERHCHRNSCDSSYKFAFTFSEQMKNPSSIIEIGSSICTTLVSCVNSAFTLPRKNVPKKDELENPFSWLPLH